MSEPFYSRVYSDRPEYADYEPPEKFQAITGIIMTRLRQHPNAVCSYSGGADSDLLIDLIETARKMAPSLPPVKYVFFNTGLEMKATKEHVKATAKKYGVEIEELRPKVNIVQATRKYGIPFVSKIMSEGLDDWQKKGVPMSVGDEYDQAEDKAAKRSELRGRYPKCESLLNFICCCNKAGEPRPNIQLVINSSKYMRDFISEFPPDFKISAKCCTYCKKNVAHSIEKDFEMVITGERRAEGGMRSVPRSADWASKNTMCFSEMGNGKFRLKPLYYVSDKDKAWYKENFGLRYSDAYEVYGLKRTGCCGCPISHRAVDDLKLIEPYEPNVVKAAWNIFGKSYEYRRQYVEYKARRMEREKNEQENIPGQMNIFDFLEEEQ